jgi:5-oxoprolinase (ATP-hydrolysing)
MAGGANGEVGQTWVERADGTRQALGYSEQTEMAAGDVFAISTPSGGGYGPPEDPRASSSAAPSERF